MVRRYLMPMVILGIGSAVASGVGSIFGGKAQAAQIRAQNEQAMRNWVSSNTQKTFNNARSQFEATLAFEQQLKRNSAIAKAAWEYQAEATEALKRATTYQQTQLSKQIQNQQSSLVNAIASKGISNRSGLMQTLALNQTLNALETAKTVEYNSLMEKRNIDKQTKNMFTQQTSNAFMPNLQLYDEAPILGDAGAAEAGGMISGLVQIGGAVAGAAVSGLGSMGSTGSSTNQFGTNLSKAPSQYGSWSSSASGSSYTPRPAFGGRLY